MATSTITALVAADAEARVVDLGMRRELDQMLEHTLQNVTGLCRPRHTGMRPRMSRRRPAAGDLGASRRPPRRRGVRSYGLGLGRVANRDVLAGGMPSFRDAVRIRGRRWTVGPFWDRRCC